MIRFLMYQIWKNVKMKKIQVKIKKEKNKNLNLRKNQIRVTKKEKRKLKAVIKLPVKKRNNIKDKEHYILNLIKTKEVIILKIINNIISFKLIPLL